MIIYITGVLQIKDIDTSFFLSDLNYFSNSSVTKWRWDAKNHRTIQALKLRASSDYFFNFNNRFNLFFSFSLGAIKDDDEGCDFFFNILIGYRFGDRWVCESGTFRLLNTEPGTIAFVGVPCLNFYYASPYYHGYSLLEYLLYKYNW